MAQDNRPPWLRPKAARQEAEPLGERTIVGMGVPQQSRNQPVGNIQASLLIRKGGSVNHVNLSNDKLTVTIGNSREESEIHINDPIISKCQLVIMRLGTEFVLVDCGVKDLVRFDGILSRQVAIPVNSRCVICMGTSVLVFQALDEGNPDAPPIRGKTGRPGASLDDSRWPQARILVDLAGRRLESWREPILIGGHPTCDAPLPGQELKPYQALIYWGPDGFYLMPLSIEAVRINGQAIEDAAPIRPEYQIEIGGEPLTCQIEGDWRGRCHAMYPDSEYVFTHFAFTSLDRNVARSFTIPLEAEAMTLGRSPTCDVILDEGSVSRVHAQMIPGGKSFYLIDNYSSNGTYVNDVKITKRRVRPGDIVEFGRNPYIVCYA